MTKNTQTAQQKYLGAAGGIVGGAIGIYSGSNVLFPVLGSVIAGAALHRMIRGPYSKWGLAAAIQAGHLSWMLIGGLIAPQFFVNVVPDVIVLSIGIVWMIARPGSVPAGLLIAYQSFALVNNTIGLISVPIGSFPHRALVVHISLRVAAIFLLFTGYRQFKKAQQQPPSLPA